MRFRYLLVLTLAVATSQVSAQKPTRVPGQRRAQLEQTFRERGEQVVRQRLNLNEDQMSKLRGVNAGISQRRNSLLMRQRSTRLALRDEMSRGSNADQKRVAQLMDEDRQIQGERLSLQQDEQKQLSQFMTPVQVAGYYGLQTQLRQRMRQLRQAAGDTGGIDLP